jgi:hypothetical protein
MMIIVRMTSITNPCIRCRNKRWGCDPARHIVLVLEKGFFSDYPHWSVPFLHSPNCTPAVAGLEVLSGHPRPLTVSESQGRMLSPLGRSA